MNLTALADSAQMHHSVDKVNLNDLLNSQQDFINQGLNAVTVTNAAARKMSTDRLLAIIAMTVVICVRVLRKRYFLYFEIIASCAA